MLKFEANDKRKLALDEKKVIWTPLVQIDFPSGTERYAPAVYSDVTSDGQVWKTGSGIIRLFPFSAERVPSRSIYDMVFYDPVHPDVKTRWLDKFTANNAYVGINLSIFLSFFYEGSWTDTVDMYFGRSIQVISDVGDDGMQITLVEFANELVKLDNNPPLKLTKANVKQRLASDNMMDFIAISRSLQFGKKDRNAT